MALHCRIKTLIWHSLKL